MAKYKEKKPETTEYKRELEIVNRYGLHARPAATFVKVAMRYDDDFHFNDVFVEKDGRQVSGKSIGGLITLDASIGSRITLTVRGDGTAEECFNALVNLVEVEFRKMDGE